MHEARAMAIIDSKGEYRWVLQPLEMGHTVLKDKNNFNLIAEVKKSSPSKGLICKNFDPIKIAIDYEKAGAKCLSVLTEKNYFGGNINYISQIKKSVNIDNGLGLKKLNSLITT